MNSYSACTSRGHDWNDTELHERRRGNQRDEHEDSVNISLTDKEEATDDTETADDGEDVIAQSFNEMEFSLGLNSIHTEELRLIFS